MDSFHKPVLVDQVLRFLNPLIGQTYLDLTAGYGGHANLVVGVTKPKKSNQVVLVDRDIAAIKALKSKFGDTANIIHQDFAAAAKQLVEEGYKSDMILLDLGVSGPQLEKKERGFSFRKTGPLDMRMDERQVLSADRIVNHLPEDQLAQIIFEYGQEGRARRIARAIVAARPVKDTQELALVIQRQFYRYQIPHPAQKIFQAIRIAVNDELKQLEKTLPLLPLLLNPGGRAVVISFHSLEDKMVKKFVQYHSSSEALGEHTLTNLTKKVIKGSEYDQHNPRSRSAKLRAFSKSTTVIT
jgi:16S rRNA (cytosine1402-N4)-methyltransferase